MAEKKGGPVDKSIKPNGTIFPFPSRSVFKRLTLFISALSVIAGSLTGIMTWVNAGFTDDFINTWLQSFGTALLIMTPMAGLLMTIFDKLARSLLPRASTKMRNILAGLFMSVIMQSVMSLVTAATTVGFNDIGHFCTVWVSTLLSVFPIGFVLIMALATWIKPRILASDRIVNS